MQKPRLTQPEPSRWDQLEAALGARERYEADQLWRSWIGEALPAQPRLAKGVPSLPPLDSQTLASLLQAATTPATAVLSIPREPHLPVQKEGLSGDRRLSPLRARRLLRALLARTLESSVLELDRKIAELQTQATVRVEGLEIPWSESGRRLAMESGARRRAALISSRQPTEAALGELFEARQARWEEAAAGLGLAPEEALELLLPAPRALLVTLAGRLLAYREDEFFAGLDRLSKERLNTPLSELEPDALPRLFLPPEGLATLPAARLQSDVGALLAAMPSWMPASKGPATLEDLATTLEGGLGTDQSPLPLCLAVQLPDDRRLSLPPAEGVAARVAATREAALCAALGEDSLASSLPPGAAIPLKALALAHQAALLATRPTWLMRWGLPAGQAAEASQRQGLALQAAERRSAAAVLLLLFDSSEVEAGSDTEERGQSMPALAWGTRPALANVEILERAEDLRRLPALATALLASALAHGLYDPEQALNVAAAARTP